MHGTMQGMIADSDHEHVITKQVCYAHIKHAATIDEASPKVSGEKSPLDALAS